MKEPNVHLGLVKMRELWVAEKVRARPPPAEELLQAFKSFFVHKSNNKGSVVEDIAARLVLKTFRHLRDTNSSEEGFGLSTNDLRIARQVMMVMPETNRDFHNLFAREIYEELERRNGMFSFFRRFHPPLQIPNLHTHIVVEGSSNSGELSIRNFVPFIKVLCLSGSSLEARALMEDFWVTNPRATESLKSMPTPQGSHKRLLWIAVLAGLSREVNEKELLNTAKMAQDSGIIYDTEFHEIMTTFFASANDVLNTKEWYEKSIQPESKPSVRAISEVLQFSIRNNQSEWSKTVFRDLLETNPDKPTWDVIFQWAAVGLGKGVEEVERMMDIMIQHNLEDDSIRPDIETINGLVSTAMSNSNPYLAERYLSLGQKSGIRPNAKTFILQMNYRIDAGDLSGAKVAYEALQSEEVLKHEDVPVINKYLRTLCSGKTPPYEEISSIVDDLEDRKQLLEADTVAALFIMNLKRRDLDEVLNVAQVHSFHLSLDDRAKVRDALVTLSLDRKIETMVAWESYTLIKQVFAETDTEIRAQLMNEFFDRGRGDMGFHVFGHMRQDIRPEMRPTVDTYIQFFEGIAKCADGESLDMVHNMMKMDSSIEPSTKLYNSLMLAYSACGEPNKAMDFWKDITISQEGPTYNSIEIVFRVCETKPFGDRPAKEIWSQMRRMEIEVTQEVFNAYVGALAGQALIDEVKSLIEGMKTEFGYGPDFMTQVTPPIHFVILLTLSQHWHFLQCISERIEG